jgi:plastocyanin
VPNRGVLVHTFGHLHPGGLHVDLSLRRDGETAKLFTSTAKYFEPAGAVSWDVSMTATRPDWAVAVRPGDVLTISATYDTSRASWYESMGIAVVWMYDGAGGDDPFTTKVDQPGVLTHGHLPENDNHGGSATTLADPRRVADGPATPAVGIEGFLYGPSDLTRTAPIPTVAQGQSITFDNLDAVGLGVWHSVTACEAPCTASTGVAYPLADAAIPFDSGQLGNAGLPTSGRETWTTPADLPTGTYTYFCRIHPFMRGAFRVVSAS